jgi:hypothetical protein
MAEDTRTKRYGMWKKAVPRSFDRIDDLPISPLD